MKYLAIALCLFATQATAQQNCAPKESIFQGMDAANATPIMVLNTPGTLTFTIFEAPDGAWAVVAVNSDHPNMACLSAEGDEIERLGVSE